MALSLVWVAPAAANPFGDPFRISTMGADDAILKNDAFDPSIALNPANNQYLTVWMGSEDSGQSWRVWGRFLDSAGHVVGDPKFPISESYSGSCGDSCTTLSANDPRVVYNAAANEFLVVFYVTRPRTDTAVETDEIYSRRVSSLGALPEPGDHKITNNIPDPSAMISTCRRSFDPAVAWNSAQNAYLVIYHTVTTSGSNCSTNSAAPVPLKGPGPSSDTENVFGQRLGADNSNNGTEFQVSDATKNHGNSDPNVVFDPRGNQFFVVWEGDTGPNGNSDEVTPEIWGQRVDPNGNLTGQNEQISKVLITEGHHAATVAYNSAANEFMVVWADNQIYGQRVDSNAQNVGKPTFRLSDQPFGANSPEVAYDSNANRFITTFQSNTKKNPTSTPGPGDEPQVFARDFNPDGSTVADAFQVSNNAGDEEPRGLVYNPRDCRFLTAWEHVQTGPAEGADSKIEIWGRFLSAAPCSSPVPVRLKARVSVGGLRAACVARGTTLSTRYAVSAAAGVRSVQVSLDGRRLKSTSKGKFTLRVATLNLASGRHTIRILVVDRAGNRTVSTRRFSVCGARRVRLPRFTG